MSTDDAWRRGWRRLRIGGHLCGHVDDGHWRMGARRSDPGICGNQATWVRPSRCGCGQCDVTIHACDAHHPNAVPQPFDAGSESLRLMRGIGFEFWELVIRYAHQDEGQSQSVSELGCILEQLLCDGTLPFIPRRS